MQVSSAVLGRPLPPSHLGAQFQLPSMVRYARTPIMPAIRLFNSRISFWRSSNWSSTLSRLLACDRFDRHASANIKLAATVNKNASARPFRTITCLPSLAQRFNMLGRLPQ
ncbi:hypothetical protein AG1IA_03325 [Rhizoctonia solani AG-1 IA]|uniref:Uncharacterized protein n=1 Tax=Thanatephorus cucumeris (strain AG1-IA) TaxID=983506 RepID=L8X1Z0_THACA|nr:hypothetical protein AG1IA_03325 [Rhizoctonia solani AG-1 IA]